VREMIPAPVHYRATGLCRNGSCKLGDEAPFPYYDLDILGCEYLMRSQVEFVGVYISVATAVLRRIVYT